MADKTCYPVSISTMAAAVVVSGFVNTIVTFVSLFACMPCMLPDAIGGASLIFYIRRSMKDKRPIPRNQAAILGALGGLLGSLLFILALLVIFLLFGNLTDMLSNTELLANSITGSGVLPVWLVLIVGVLIIPVKIIASAITAFAISSLDSS